MRIEVHHTWATVLPQLDQLQNALNLENQFVNVRWMQTWWGIFGGQKRLACLFFKQADHPVAFIPLCEEEWLGTLTLRFVGHGWANRLEILCTEGYLDAVIDAFWTYLSNRSGLILDLIDVPDASVTYQRLVARSSAHHFSAMRFPLYKCPVAILDDSWEKFFVKTIAKKKRRREFLKWEERLSGTGRVEFSMLREPLDSESCNALVAELRHLHQARFQRVWNPMKADCAWHFFARLLQTMLGNGLVLSLLRVDGILISFYISVECGRVLVDYISAFHPAFRLYNIGHVHLMKWMRWSIEQGYAGIDFSKGESFYKHRWSKTSYTNYRLIYPVKMNLPRRALLKLWSLGYDLLLFGRDRGYNKRVKAILGTIVGRGLVCGQQRSEEAVERGMPSESGRWQPLCVATMRELLPEDVWENAMALMYTCFPERLEILRNNGDVRIRDVKAQRLIGVIKIGS